MHSFLVSIKDKIIKKFNDKKKSLCIFLICLFFLMPILTSFFPLKNYKIFWILGIRTDNIQPSLSISSLCDKTYQKDVEKLFSDSMTWNKLYIKTFNTAMFYLFNKSYSDESRLVIGKNKYIFGREYFAEYVQDSRFKKLDKDKLDETIQSLSDIQKYLSKKNKLMILLIAPSKAPLCMDYLPARYYKFNQHLYKDAEYRYFYENIKNTNIKYINVVNYIEEINKKHKVFEDDDVVWSTYTTYFISNKLIDMINNSQISTAIPQVKIKSIKLIQGTEKSNLSTDLLNIFALPKTYKYTKVTPAESKTPSNLKMAIIGGCFTDKLIYMLMEASVFKEIEHYSTNSLAERNNEVKYEVFSIDKNNNLQIEEKYVKIENFASKVTENEVVILDFNQSFILHKSLDVFMPQMLEYLKKN